MSRLKRASNKVEILEVGETKLHAVRPDKSAWDEYADALFDRAAKDNKFKSGIAIQVLYRNCIKKIEGAAVEENGVEKVVDITSPDEIVDFLIHLGDAEAGRNIDAWLLGLGELTKVEAKNSNGEQPVS